MNIVVTNNPMVRARVSGVEYLDTDFLGVLKAVRDRIHAGHGLLTHPLSGSVKPGETPYKTVLISAGKSSLDEKALSIIEDSIQTCLKFMDSGAGKAGSMKKNWSPEALADFQLVDYDLIFGMK